MKYLLNGVAIAAALALATPALAQTPMTPAAPKAPAAAAPAAKPAAAKQMHHRRPMRHMAGHMMRRGHRGMHMAPGDQMTEQLNREELSRIQGGGGPGMAPPPPPPSGPGPRPSGR